MPAKKSSLKKKPVAVKQAVTRHVQTRLNDDGWQALKLLSVEERRPMQALFVEALNDLLKKYHKPAVVEGPE